MSFPANPSDQQTYTNPIGTVYVYNLARNAWNIKTTAVGVTGIQGMTGLALGSTGISGQTGIQGLTGIYGQTGIRGSTGIQGVTGIGVSSTVAYGGLYQNYNLDTTTSEGGPPTSDGTNIYFTNRGNWVKWKVLSSALPNANVNISTNTCDMTCQSDGTYEVGFSTTLYQSAAYILAETVFVDSTRSESYPISYGNVRGPNTLTGVSILGLKTNNVLDTRLQANVNDWTCVACRGTFWMDRLA